MSEALRSLLAEFVVQVDKAGELARGNEAVTALKERLVELQAEFAKVKAPAVRAGKSVQQAFAGGFAGAPGLAEALRAHSEQAAGNLFGMFGAAQGAQHRNGELVGPERMFGPTRDTLNAANQAAAEYSKTLRGRLGSAASTVREIFSGSGSGSGGGLVGSLATVRNGLIALGVGTAARAVKHVVDGIGDISEGAARLGVTTDEFQRLSTLARMNATDVGTLGTAFRTLATNAVEPSKDSAAAFAQLGIAVKDGTGQFKTSQELFFETGEALSGVTNETLRTQLAQKLLGRSAVELKPLFAQGTEAFRRQREEMAKLRVLSPEVITAADELSDSWVALGTQLLATAGPVLQDTVFPALKVFTSYLFKGIDILGKWLDRIDLASTAATALAYAVSAKLIPGLVGVVANGVKAAGSMRQFAMEGARAAVSFGRLVLGLLLVEDFIGFLNGDDSETGRLLTKIFGKEGKEGTLQALKDLGGALKDVWNWLLGNGMGDTARTLYRDLSDAISLLVNDLLKLIGIGEGGINGPFKLGGGGHKLLSAGQFAGNLASGDLVGAGKAAAGFFDTGPANDTIPVPSGQYGPPTATGVNGAVVYAGDKTITINGMRVEDAKVVAGEMEAALERDRNALIATYGGF